MLKLFSEHKKQIGKYNSFHIDFKYHLNQSDKLYYIVV